ncbi:MAG: hypothetical protein QW812_01705 [Thermoplasmataceae archaeon]
MAGKVSKKQVAFIDALISDSEERRGIAESYLRKIKKSDFRDLSKEEASSLITSLKSSEREDHSNSPPMTKKQNTYIEYLLRDETIRAEAQRILSLMGVTSISSLTIDQASDLIDRLKKIPIQPGRKSRKFASRRQVSFIRSLAQAEDRKRILENYLAKKGKANLEDLYTDEASEIIDLLR